MLISFRFLFFLHLMSMEVLDYWEKVWSERVLKFLVIYLDNIVGLVISLSNNFQ